MIDNFKTGLVLRVAPLPREEILNAMGYKKPTSANLERLQTVLDDSEFGLKEWWLTGHDITYQNIALAPPSVTTQIPEKSPSKNVLPGYDGVKPVFVRHYWLTGTQLH